MSSNIGKRPLVQLQPAPEIVSERLYILTRLKFCESPLIHNFRVDLPYMKGYLQATVTIVNGGSLNSNAF